MLIYEECKDIWNRSRRSQLRWNKEIDGSYEYNINTICRRLQISKDKYKDQIIKYFKRFKEEMGNE